MTSPYPYRWQDIAMLALGALGVLGIPITVIWALLHCTPLVLLMEMM